MLDSTQFPIVKRWPAQHPERLQLYSLPTPNGVKVSIMLEEIGCYGSLRMIKGNKGIGGNFREQAGMANPR